MNFLNRWIFSYPLKNSWGKQNNWFLQIYYSWQFTLEADDFGPELCIVFLTLWDLNKKLLQSIWVREREKSVVLDL